MLLIVGAGALASLTFPAESRAVTPAGSAQREDLSALIVRQVGSDLRPFYAARGNRPLWFDGFGRITPAARALLDQIENARLDGLMPRRLKADKLAQALDRVGSGDPRDLVRAELALSTGYVAYVKALRSARRDTMIYESQALSPAVPTTTAALQAAASARSLERHVDAMAWMHPLYAPMRAALAGDGYDPARRRQIEINLGRIRALPANPAARYVLIDAASARLWMYKDGAPVDSMRVVVGKPQEQTPMMAGFIRYAIVNPYWNVPDDLVRSRISYNVLTKGLGYLRGGGYQVMSGWEDDAHPLDPAFVDWQAVSTGAAPPRVRQLPGGSNFMGTVKFMFPNALGIYLHDTPDKALMAADARQLSSGCVRLEDAARLGRWLMGKSLPRQLRTPEQRLELAEPVPVYITYLTAMPENGRIAFREDTYGRDAEAHSKRSARPAR